MNTNSLLTILTATYNRGGLSGGLNVLYESLCNQTCKKFIWMIVDDGSTDNTERLVNNWMQENKIEIIYFYKENGGKHTALNYGISQLKTKLCHFVDSDDFLTENAVEIIYNYYEKYSQNQNLCGYTFLRKFPDGTINGKIFTPDEKISTYIDARINSDDIYSDKTSVFYTSVLKLFPFPEFAGEKFLGEDIVWIRMAKKYSMVHINKAILVGSYQNNGLTKNRRVNNIKSPNGCIARSNEFMCKEIKLKYRIRGAIQYIIYGKFARKNVRNLYLKANSKLLFSIFYIPSFILYIIWKKKYNQSTSSIINRTK